jgi:hypothetical protein
MPAVKSVKGIPMERVRCNQETVVAFYDRFEAAFVWNIDESGCSAWGDKQEEYRVLVPDSYQADCMHVPVDRHSKRPTLVDCISADRSAMKVMIIVDRTTTEADLDLYVYDGEKY